MPDDALTDMSNGSVNEILNGLSSGRPDASWQQFLDEYSSLIIHIARRYENDQDRAMDCYVYVCEKLSEKDFRRLLKFKPEGAASFRTWLTTVTGNLCIDWRRKQFGRRRDLRAIASLPELEQLVFHYLYNVGLTRRECLHVLPGQYSFVTEQHIVDIDSRLHTALSSRQRWRLIARRRETISLYNSASYDQAALQTAESQPKVDDIVEAEQNLEKLEKAMSQLSSDERLLLRLRYLQGLTLKDVARLMKLNDLHQVRRRLKRAVTKLSNLMAN